MQSPRLSFLARLSIVPALFLAIQALPACSSADGGEGSGASDLSGAGTDDDVVDDAADGGKTKLTWIKIYDEAFAPGTPGHCGNSGCHATLQAGFLCGKTASSCLAGMKKKGLLSTKAPKTSILGSTASSPLRWVHTGGVMPLDNKTAEPKLGADIEAWVKAGAPGILLPKKDAGAGASDDGEETADETDDTEN
jgi:hypothetical protein